MSATKKVTGICRYCQRRIAPPPRGPVGSTCKRKPCQQAAARERQRRHRAEVIVGDDDI